AVVVGMDVPAGKRGDHLVRVHVRRGAGARLENVDRELVVELAGSDTVRCGGDPLRLLRIEQPELGVHARSSGLDPPQPACDGGRNRLAGDWEILDSFSRFGTPELLPRLRRHGASLAALMLHKDGAAQAVARGKRGGS